MGGPRRASLACALLAAALVAGACGGDGHDGEASPPQPSATAPTSAPPPETTAGTATTTTLGAPTAESLSGVEVVLTEVAVADQPVHLIVRPGTGQRYVVERTGAIRLLGDGGLVTTPLVDVGGETVAEGERGLLGAAFSPDGTHLYVSYTDVAGDTRLAEWALAGDGVDPTSRRLVLTLDQPYATQNGGHVTFGPDGLLWFGLGDGGSAGDPADRAQDPASLLGKILRIDPHRQGEDPYAIPGDNPFAGGGGRGEVAVLGVRNPWRFSFDRATGALWVADVGQDAVEEVTALPAGAALGANLGWDRLEGSRPFAGDPPPDAVAPVHEYGRDEGISITGGVVYRGDAIEGLAGAYVFGDLGTGEIWALPTDGTAVGERVVLGASVEPGTLVSFAEGPDGEVYVLSLAGPVYRLDPA